MRDCPGVYVGTCLVNNKRYVGSSKKALKRIGEHKAALARGTHINGYLQNAYNKYGSEGFSWEIVCKRPEDLFVEEQSWIEKLQTHDRRYGYNLSYPVRVNKPHPLASKKMKAKWKDPEFRKLWEADLLRGSRKVSELYKTDPEFVARMNEIRTGSWNEKNKGVVSEKAKKRFSDPAYKARMDPHREKGYRVLAELRKNPEFVAKQVKGMVDRWKDPENRKKQAARMAALWANPEFREKQRKMASERISAYNKKRALAAGTRDSLNNSKKEAVEASDKESMWKTKRMLRRSRAEELSSKS